MLADVVLFCFFLFTAMPPGKLFADKCVNIFERTCFAPDASEFPSRIDAQAPHALIFFPHGDKPCGKPRVACYLTQAAYSVSAAEISNLLTQLCVKLITVLVLHFCRNTYENRSAVSALLVRYL